jgi:hypothetical protein
MTDIADLAQDGEDDVAFALRLIADPGVAAVGFVVLLASPSSAGQAALRLPETNETLAAADRLAMLASGLTSGSAGHD